MTHTHQSHHPSFNKDADNCLSSYCDLIDKVLMACRDVNIDLSDFRDWINSKVSTLDGVFTSSNGFGLGRPASNPGIGTSYKDLMKERLLGDGVSHPCQSGPPQTCNMYVTSRIFQVNAHRLYQMANRRGAMKDLHFGAQVQRC